MCNPVLIMAGFTIAAGAVQYKTSRDSQKFNEAVADQNAKVAEAQAVDAERLGQIEAGERRLLLRQQLASQQVGFAAQNVEQTGTALDILGDTAMFGEIDETRIRANAERQAWGYRMQGYGIQTQKRLDAYQGKMGRFGTILTTGANMAGAWQSGRAAKTPSRGNSAYGPYASGYRYPGGP